MTINTALQFDNLVPLEDDLTIDDLDDEAKLPTESIVQKIKKLNIEEYEDKMAIEDEKSTVEPGSIHRMILFAVLCHAMLYI